MSEYPGHLVPERCVIGLCHFRLDERWGLLMNLPGISGGVQGRRQAGSPHRVHFSSENALTLRVRGWLRISHPKPPV